MTTNTKTQIFCPAAGRTPSSATGKWEACWETDQLNILQQRDRVGGDQTRAIKKENNGHKHDSNDSIMLFLLFSAGSLASWRTHQAHMLSQHICCFSCHFKPPGLYWRLNDGYFTAKKKKSGDAVLRATKTLKCWYKCVYFTKDVNECLSKFFSLFWCCFFLFFGFIIAVNF